MTSCLLSAVLVVAVAAFSGTVGVKHSDAGHLPPAEVHYTVWTERKHGIAIRGSISLLVPHNSTFYSVMLKAAEISSRFRFEAEVTNCQHFITSIGGVSCDEKKERFWMLYKLQEMPNPLRLSGYLELTPKGVDRTYVSDGDLYLFWLKRVPWARSNISSTSS